MPDNDCRRLLRDRTPEMRMPNRPPVLSLPLVVMLAVSLSSCEGRVSEPADLSQAPDDEATTLSAMELRAQDQRERWWSRGTATSSTDSAAALVVGPVSVAWVPLVNPGPYAGLLTLSLTGKAFKNVEVFQGKKMLARAVVSADLTRATVDLDTRRLADGTVTLTAHAWDSAPGTSFTSDADAGNLVLKIDNTTPRPPPPVSLAWVPLAKPGPYSGTLSLSLTGQSFKNVEIFQGGTMLARALVSADLTHATVDLDTHTLADGTVTLTAHAWNSPAGSSYTSEADAGTLVFTVDNSVPPPPTSVSLTWVPPAVAGPYSGVLSLSLKGQGFQNVEVFQAGTMIARAVVSSDRTRATAQVDTTRLANGSVTLTAHGWNSPAGSPFTSDADAGNLVITVNNVGPPPPSPPPGNDYHPSGDTLAFGDEFNGSELDRSKWCTRYIFGGGPALQVPDPACTTNGEGTLDFLNDEQQRYVDTNNQGRKLHEVSGGLLTIWATNTRNDSYAKYESAMLRSKQLFKPSSSVSYYVTARLKLPSVKGSWPAFWLNSDRRADGSTTWPPEIDIIDAALNAKDDTADMLHQAGIVKGKQTSSGNTTYTFVLAGSGGAPHFDTTWSNFYAGKSMRDVWVELAIEWSQGSVCYFVDGQRTNCHEYNWVENSGAAAAPAHVLLNLAVGGGWAGRYGVDDSSFPIKLQADYVRIYKK
jgi:beta-glucanase (GH16 family)